MAVLLGVTKHLVDGPGYIKRSCNVDHASGAAVLNCQVFFSLPPISPVEALFGNSPAVRSDLRLSPSRFAQLLQSEDDFGERVENNAECPIVLRIHNVRPTLSEVWKKSGGLRDTPRYRLIPFNVPS